MTPPTTWWPARSRCALLAILTGALTAAWAVAMGGPDVHVDLALLYVLVVVLALLSPAMITLQVLAGQVVLATILLGRDTSGALLLAPAIVGVVATAELLAVVARLDLPIERAPGLDLHRALLAAVAGGAGFAAVVLVAGVPGPGGLLAISLASAACAGLATLLSRIRA
jgi:hypothetical protein